MVFANTKHPYVSPGVLQTLKIRANLQLVKPVELSATLFTHNYERMSTPPLSHPYVPNFALRELYRRVFEHIQVEEGWADQVRELSKKGSVLYVLPNLNWLDFLALDYLTKRHNLPPLLFANDLGLWLLNPDGPNLRGTGLKNMLLPHRRSNPEERLRDAIESGGSAALFLKRPPGVLDLAAGATGGRGMREGDLLVRNLLAMQRSGDANIILLPLVFVWSKSPDKLATRPWDLLLGPRAWPTPTRALGQFAYNRNHASLRWGDEIEVGPLLEHSDDVTDRVLVRRITYMVLRRIERERRAVVGPTEKAPERVRAEILRSPRLHSVITDMAGDDPHLLRDKLAAASDMLKELQAVPNADIVKAVGVGLKWAFNRIYRGIEFDQADIDRVRKASREGAVILLPSHKSHIDYLVMSYFFYERNLMVPLIAAGDNLNFQPVGPIFRRCGAFFIRRSFKGDRLYAAVVDAYIRRLIRDGFPMELFLEGGRSRTGKLLEPKLGLLKMIVDSALAVPSQRAHFVPVSIGYERVVEADSYQHELTGGEKKKEEASDLLSAGEVLRHRYGRINLQFGSIMTLEDIAGELGIAPQEMGRPAKRRAVVTRLANRVMDEINRVTAVTPGALTAMALLSVPEKDVSERDVLEIAEVLLGYLLQLGARVSSAMLTSRNELRSQSIREALQMFVDAQLVERVDPADGKSTRYTLLDGKRLQLDTSKNIIIHFFVERGLIACSFDRDDQGNWQPTSLDLIVQRVLYLSKLFKHEFRFRADKPFDEIFEATVAGMVRDGHLKQDNGMLLPGTGQTRWTGEQWLSKYQAILRTFMEGYWVAAVSLDQLLTEPRTEKELLKIGLAVGHSLHLNQSLAGREAISKPLLANAYQSFTALGYLRVAAAKLEIAEAYQSHSALEEIAGVMHGFITGRHEVLPS